MSFLTGRKGREGGADHEFEEKYLPNFGFSSGLLAFPACHTVSLKGGRVGESQPGQVIDSRIKAPLKAGNRIEGTPAEIDEILQFNQELLSYRQTAEWGNRGLQGSFGRLRVPLDIGSARRRGDILETCIRAFCLRTRRMGVNQIKSIYVEQVGEMGMWANFEDMLFADQRRNDRVLRFHITASY